MPSMKSIKSRMKSVSSTKQITKAMNLVSTSKLARSREKLRNERPYSDEIRGLLSYLAKDEKILDGRYFAKSPGKNILFILVTSDRGLCGAYNSNVSRACRDMIRGEQQGAFICVGGKGRDFYARRGKRIYETFVGITEAPAYEDAEEIAQIAIGAFEDKEFDKVLLVYTRFENVVSYVPSVVQLLPLVAENFDVKDEGGFDIGKEPASEALMEYAVPNYVSSMVFNAICESAASQQASRMISMETATDNAEKMISNLNLQYNRMRQNKITQEIIEIVSGANALN